MVIFKFLGFLLGFKIGGFSPGSQLIFGFGGLLIGYMLDKALDRKLAFLTYQKRASKESQAALGNTFINSYIGLLRIVAEVDGKITKKEIENFEKVINIKLKLNRRGKSYCRSNFTKKINQPPQLLAAQILQVYGAESAALENILYSLFEMAACDEAISEVELDTLTQIALFFGISEDTFSAISHHFGLKTEGAQNQQSKKQSDYKEGSEKDFADNLHSKSRNDPYEILGCKKEASHEELKQRFRKLAMDFHPDRIAAKDLPEDFIKFASSRFQEVQKAYDLIRAERGF